MEDNRKISEKEKEADKEQTSNPFGTEGNHAAKILGDDRPDSTVSDPSVECESH
jgi:hypothetical protein